MERKTTEEVGNVSFRERTGENRIDYRDSVFPVPQEE